MFSRKKKTQKSWEIDEREQKEIFDRFEAVDTSVARKYMSWAT